MNCDRSHRYCAREFNGDDMELIRRIIMESPGTNRANLSRMVCKELQWFKIDGGLKEMSCRVAMLRMQRDGLIQLPAPQTVNANGKRYQRRTPQAEPESSIVTTPAGELHDLHLGLVFGKAASHLWNEYIDRYHYLGYQPLPGAQLRYFAYAQNGRPMALLGFSAAAWMTAPRDDFIGWTHEQRQRNLHLVINNSRLLILPWIRSKNLASRLLSMAPRILTKHWCEQYGYRPVLMETFVEQPRFHGSSYKAANWIVVGETTGRGKLGIGNRGTLPRKQVLVYPLIKQFRRELSH